MLKKLAVRAAAMMLAVAPLAASPGTGVAAGGTGTLFGVTGFGQSVLSSIDPTAGSVTNIEDLAGPQQGQVVSFTGDPVAHRIYALRETTIFIPPSTINVINQILTVSSDNGAVIATATVKAPGEIAFDPGTGSLYQLGFPNTVLRVNPATGSSALVATYPALPGAIVALAVLPGANTLFIGQTVEDFETGGFNYQLDTINTITGAVSTGPVNPGRLGFIQYDAASRLLLASDSTNLYSVDPLSGVETTIAEYNSNPQALNFFAGAVDPTTNTVYLHLNVYDFYNPTDQIVAINDVTGSVSLSPNMTVDQLESLYFQASVTVTPAMPIDDVKAAVAAGAITKTGVASTLLSDLNAASAARDRGQCKTAANIYQQFIQDVSAQTGKSIAVATASLLTSEAEYLQTSCS